MAPGPGRIRKSLLIERLDSRFYSAINYIRLVVLLPASVISNSIRRQVKIGCTDRAVILSVSKAH